METWNRFRISPGEWVLDIGCGAHPFPLATHLADLSATDHSQRFGLPIPPSSRPLVLCTVEAIPYRDKSFDFVYCTHVLEHTRNPQAACEELMRVSKRGYIECPRGWMEYPFSSPDHCWMVDYEQNRIIFREKLAIEYSDILGIQYRLLDWMCDPDFMEYWRTPEVRRLRNVEVYWENSFDFQVIRKEERENAGAFPWFYESKLQKKHRRNSAELRQFLISEFQRVLSKRSE